VVLSCVGIYSINHSAVELLMTAFFGVLGYVLRKFEFEPTPLLLGFVLSGPIEENIHRALLFAQGDPMTFLRHPIGATLLAVAASLLLLTAVPRLRSFRRGL
jgi:putative tricarboxylic transport membrane protein